VPFLTAFFKLNICSAAPFLTVVQAWPSKSRTGVPVATAVNSQAVEGSLGPGPGRGASIRLTAAADWEWPNQGPTELAAAG
jgi:hypothetical protein